MAKTVITSMLLYGHQITLIHGLKNLFLWCSKKEKLMFPFCISSTKSVENLIYDFIKHEKLFCGFYCVSMTPLILFVRLKNCWIIDLPLGQHVYLLFDATSFNNTLKAFFYLSLHKFPLSFSDSDSDAFFQ